MQENRRKEMAAYIARCKSVTMNQLCSEFNVSMNTIRADVSALVKSGIAEKIYGGVRSTMQQEVPMFTHRAKFRPDVKFSIARAASGLINDGDTLFIDAGTTTMHMLGFIPAEKKITVITANLHIISQAAAKPNIEVIVLPGTLNRRTNSLADISTLEFLGHYNFKKAFMGATSISADGKLNVKTYLEYEIKRQAIQQSETRYLLCDSSKYGNNSLMSYADISDINCLITDEDCPQELAELCRIKDVQLITAE